MVSKFHHERESIFQSFSVLYPLENPIDQTGLVSCRSGITNKMGDVIHLEEWFGFELQNKRIFFPALSSSSTVYHTPVVLQKCDLWQRDRQGGQCLERSNCNIKQNTNRKKDLGLKTRFLSVDRN